MKQRTHQLQQDVTNLLAHENRKILLNAAKSIGMEGYHFRRYLQGAYATTLIKRFSTLEALGILDRVRPEDESNVIRPTNTNDLI